MMSMERKGEGRMRRIVKVERMGCKELGRMREEAGREGQMGRTGRIRVWGERGRLEVWRRGMGRMKEWGTWGEWPRSMGTWLAPGREGFWKMMKRPFSRNSLRPDDPGLC